MTYTARKVVIITEKSIAEKVAKLIESCGATGYTVSAAGGKGDRGVRMQERDTLFDSFSNVKFEVITTDDTKAQNIAAKVADTYFDNYAGVTYMQDVTILRPQKF
jgi:nitrogen regulatory protein PII